MNLAPPWLCGDAAQGLAPGCHAVLLWDDGTVAVVTWPDGSWSVWRPGVRRELGQPCEVGAGGWDGARLGLCRATRAATRLQAVLS